MEKKTSFRPDFGPFWPKFGPKKFFSWVLPLLDIIHCCKLSLYAISRKTNKDTVINVVPNADNLVQSMGECLNE